MRPNLAPVAAALAVLGLLTWLAVVATRLPRPESPAPGAEDAPAAMTRGSAAPCAVPLAWRVARLDDGFGIGAGEARAAVQMAMTLWENATGRRLFTFDTVAGFPIRFVYEEPRIRPGERVEAGVYREAAQLQDGRVDSVSREIRIYRFGDSADLVRILAHELGHALGLDHDTVPGSVMSPQYGFGTAAPAGTEPAIHQADLARLRARCPEL